MVPNISEKRITFLFVEGLLDPLKGFVWGFEPSNLPDVIKRALSLESSAPPKSRISAPPSRSSYSGLSGSIQRENQLARSVMSLPPRPPTPAAAATRLDDATRNDLRKKNLCFSCKKPWERGQRCLGKGRIHYIEVASDEDDSDGESKAEEEPDLDNSELMFLKMIILEMVL